VNRTPENEEQEAVRDFERVLPPPTAALERVEAGPQVLDPVDEDWALSPDMIGEQHDTKIVFGAED
jgi:hypothetical protein